MWETQEKTVSSEALIPKSKEYITTRGRSLADVIASLMLSKLFGEKGFGRHRLLTVQCLLPNFPGETSFSNGDNKLIPSCNNDVPIDSK